MESKDSLSKRYYRPELDIVRFLAFLLVFLDHTVPNSPDPRVASVLRGFAPMFYASAGACRFGLSLFFTLSAFLISELLLREREATGAVRVKQFNIRRILRIWPLYYLAVSIGVVVALLPGDHRGELVQMGWFAIFMGSCYSLIRGGTATPMGQLWSISVEEQFYLFAPWVVKLFNRRVLYVFCLILILIANGWLYHLGRVFANDLRVWTNPFVQFQCFAAGILLSLFVRGQVLRTTYWQRLLLLVCAWSCWFYASHNLHFRFRNGSDNPGSLALIGAYALGTVGCVLLLLAFLNVDQKLLPRWAIYLGRISYGLYVFHELSLYLVTHIIFGHISSFASPLYFLKAILTLGLNVIIAIVCYRYFETPFLRMKRRYTVIQSQPV